MEELIQSFQNKLATDVPDLKYIDEDWGQLDYYENYPPVQFPCALIDVQSAQYTHDGQLQQRGVLTIVVKLYLLKLSNTSTHAPQSQKDEAKRGWTLLKEVNRALHGQHFLPNGFAAPIRTAMQRVKRRDGVYERDITYTIGVTDNSCVPVRVTAPAKPTVKVRMMP